MFRRDLASPMSEFLGVMVLLLYFMVRRANGFEQHDVVQPEAFITYIVFFTQIINPAKALSTGILQHTTRQCCH